MGHYRKLVLARRKDAEIVISSSRLIVKVTPEWLASDRHLVITFREFPLPFERKLGGQTPHLIALLQTGLSLPFPVGMEQTMIAGCSGAVQDYLKDDQTALYILEQEPVILLPGP